MKAVLVHYCHNFGRQTEVLWCVISHYISEFCVGHIQPLVYVGVTELSGYKSELCEPWLGHGLPSYSAVCEPSLEPAGNIDPLHSLTLSKRSEVYKEQKSCNYIFFRDHGLETLRSRLNCTLAPQALSQQTAIHGTPEAHSC